jgi:hypothetical protein
VTSKTLFVRATSKKNMELKGGVIMGVTIDQKLNACIHNIRRCDNQALLLIILQEAHERLNELVEAYNEDI